MDESTCLRKMKMRMTTRRAIVGLKVLLDREGKDKASHRHEVTMDDSMSSVSGSTEGAGRSRFEDCQLALSVAWYQHGAPPMSRTYP